MKNVCRLFYLLIDLFNYFPSLQCSTRSHDRAYLMTNDVQLYLIGQWTRNLDLGDHCMYLCTYNRRRRQTLTSYFGMKSTCSSKGSRPDGRSRTTINATPNYSTQPWCLVLFYRIAAFCILYSVFCNSVFCNSVFCVLYSVFCILHSTAATSACQSGISFSQPYNILEPCGCQISAYELDNCCIWWDRYGISFFHHDPSDAHCCPFNWF